jgi:hypothetical protein
MNPSKLNSVWSFWSKPACLLRRRSWFTDLHHLLGWVLSVETGRRHYPNALLVTDDDGARLLVDRLELRFEQVSTSLNKLRDQDPSWWALGKLLAYQEQVEPFVHIDADVFLWKPLPREVTDADVFAQNPEPMLPGRSWYQPGSLEQALNYPSNGWLPPEWHWYRTNFREQRGECCGIFGGQRIDFIDAYADLAWRIINHDQNRVGLGLLSPKVNRMILLEQYLLSACVEYHRQKESSPFYGVNITHLFRSMEEAFCPTSARAVGYTHLAGNAKSDPRLAKRLEYRVQREYPEHYERCLNLVGNRRSLVNV